MEQGAEAEVRLVAMVCYGASARCPQCGCHIPSGVEHVRVMHGRQDIEFLGDAQTGQVIIHGSDGPAVFDRCKVLFVKVVPDRERDERRRR